MIFTSRQKKSIINHGSRSHVHDFARQRDAKPRTGRYHLQCLSFSAALGLSIVSQPAISETIGVSMVPPVAFFQYLRDGMQAASRNRQGLSIQFEYAEDGEGQKQIDQVKKFISSKVGAIIVLPADASSTAKITEMAQKADIPLIYVNNGPREDWFSGRVALVLPNDLVAGRLQMTKISQLLNGKGRIAIINGPTGHSASVLRTQGVKEVAADFPGIVIAAEAPADWDRAKAERIVSGWLSNSGGIDAILANNDEMAIGAANAVDAAKIPRDKILIAGVDATPDGLKAMQQKRLALTVQQNAMAEGRQAIEDALKLIKNEYVQQYDWINFELVTDKTLPKFISK